MKTFILLAALASTISASILPIKLNFNGKYTPSLKGVSNCAGHENDVMTVAPGGSMPDEVCMPGSMQMDVVTKFTEDMPTDLILKLDLNKLDPFPMTVPCLNGIGSCEYELCPMIVDMADTLCPHFPPTQPCGCPLLAGDMALSGLEIPVPDMGLLGVVMAGGYEATATFYGASNKDKVLGCLNLTFTLKDC
ncbi:ganglioside GM2 activator [Eurytemora carolleeae]|uniref:ganglioside GM2 activator n=1 Tax=Eurytemora carolleeae TaxID=1294199 RepID=UPI000C762C68|nr:ganglioside GM2 activator [Eurytemora carolleeae]|eukprot:XP_023329952.1 ganglioside GM2 activator-like [Eurytemora affinis]